MFFNVKSDSNLIYAQAVHAIEQWNVHGGDTFQTALFVDFQQSGQISDKFWFPFDEVNNQRKITHGNN